MYEPYILNNHVINPHTTRACQTSVHANTYPIFSLPSFIPWSIFYQFLLVSHIPWKASVHSKVVKSNVCLSGVVMIQYFGCNTSTSCHRCNSLQWESSKIALLQECNVRLALYWRWREYRPMTKGWRMLTKALHVAWWWGEGNFTASDICNSPPSIATCYFHYPVSPPFLPNFPSYYFFPVSKILFLPSSLL